MPMLASTTRSLAPRIRRPTLGAARRPEPNKSPPTATPAAAAPIRAANSRRDNPSRSLLSLATRTSSRSDRVTTSSYSRVFRRISDAAPSRRHRIPESRHNRACYEPLCASSHELLVLGFDPFRRGFPGHDHDPVLESQGVSRLERRVVPRFTAGEVCRSERIRCKQAVAACVPVRRVSGIARMIENRERHRFTIYDPGQHHPARARSPHVIADLPFAAAVLAGDSCVVQFRYGRFVSVAVGEYLGFVRWMLERPCDADAKGALFRVAENDTLVARGPPCDAVDGAPVAARMKDEARLLRQNHGTVGHHPVGGRLELAAAGAIDGPRDRAVHNCALGRHFVGWRFIRVSPEVNSVHVAIGKPGTDLVRMIRA